MTLHCARNAPFGFISAVIYMLTFINIIKESCVDSLTIFFFNQVKVLNILDTELDIYLILNILILFCYYFNENS